MREQSNPWDGLILIALAALVIPALLPKIRDAALGWLLEKQVLVSADQALFEIPTTGAGLDLRRILALVLVVALIACLRWAASTRSPQEQSR
ncbi:hypothetical protein [Janibacter sp. LM]|uniref:hypothetical protein n=1 Tax=Janibacter sp. LM TaxID=3144845 RepID=UPI0031F6BB26